MKTRNISNLKIPRPLSSFESSATTLRTTRLHISEDRCVLQSRCESPIYRNFRVYTSIRIFKSPACTYRYIHVLHVCIYVRYRSQVRIAVRLRIMLLHFCCVCCPLPTADQTENTLRHSAMYDIVLPTELLKGCLCVEQQGSCLKTCPDEYHDAISCHKNFSIETNKYTFLESLQFVCSELQHLWLAIYGFVSFTVP